MALASSGTISIGGSTANRSINLELDRSATATSSLGESALRTLAGVSSGAISMSNFHGKSNAWTATVTVGVQSVGGGKNNPTTYRYGYQTLSPAHGSISDTTCDKISNATIQRTRWNSQLNQLSFRVSGSHSNSGWTTFKVGSSTYNRSSATYTNGGSYTAWVWSTSSNPYGTSGTKTIEVA